MSATDCLNDTDALPLHVVNDLDRPHRFAASIKPVDSRGRGMVVDYNRPVDCGGVLVSPGDLVVADCDRIIVVPAEAVADGGTRCPERGSAGCFQLTCLSSYGMIYDDDVVT